MTTYGKQHLYTIPFTRYFIDKRDLSFYWKINILFIFSRNKYGFGVYQYLNGLLKVLTFLILTIKQTFFGHEMNSLVKQQKLWPNILTIHGPPFC